jgi:hypothetical protein
MTEKKTGRKGGQKKLKLKKETLRDLDVKGKAGKAKGGVAVPYPPNSDCIFCYSVSCPPEPIPPTHWYRRC